MTMKCTRRDGALGIRFALAGAAMAAALGAEAGAALRPAPEERGAAPAPQLMVVDQRHLVELEDAGGGWPGRAPG